MKVTITLELSEVDQIHIRQNSIERVMNNAIFVGGKVERVKDESLAERASTLWQDCEELKSVTSRLWNAAREAIYTAKLEGK